MEDDKIQRPFNFMVPFWGRRYREYFVDLCLPSLLAPNNISLLRAEDGHRFLMATTREDWQAIEHLPIMERLRPHATPTLVEVESGAASPTAAGAGAHAQYTSVIRHQTTCLKLLFEEAYRHRSYGCLMSPDHLFSDGTVSAMTRYAKDGYQFVLCPSLRQTEEGVMEDLVKRGYLSAGERPSRTGRPLDLPPRVMADFFVRHLHSEMAVFEYAAAKPGRPYIFPFCFWPVPGGRGIILHEFFGVPVVMDFTSLKPGHADCLDRDDYENIYLSENFFRDYKGRVAFVQDSDEFNIVSVTPSAADFSAPLAPARRAPRWRRAYAQMCDIRDSMNFYVGRNWEPVRRDLFLQPFRLHGKDLDATWMEEERRANRRLAWAVGDYFEAGLSPRVDSASSIFSTGLRVLLFETLPRASAAAVIKRVAASPGRLLSMARVAGRRAALALTGDKIALRWISWRLRKLAAAVVNRPFQEPRPPTPE